METEDGNESNSDERQMFKAVCSDCGEECEVPFKPTEGKPVRCRDCFMKGRSFNRNRGGFNRDRGPRQMHKAVCGECKKDCEVPFKPTEGKPVLCRDCYKKSKGFD